ncbi:class I SAM-dependent methyltransferase [Desulfogranum mediterraneum]|uniref:class I SAM-dependent methyltransferase n=1 Tax=Desulfogranum mediterraneum TaxID=160661 RepID=UPI00042A4976|nr:class I SAM-dependent methyltransferase [Desulfogranum mediterraneum]
MQAAERESYWSRNTAHYDGHTNHGMDALVRTIVEEIGAVERILDLGAGTGRAALACARQVQWVDAVDLEPEMIALARKKAAARCQGNVSFLVQDGAALGFADGVFDAVLILNSLHLMSSPQSVLGEARRVLKSSGRLLAPTYCHGESAEGLESYQQWAASSGHHSHQLFSCESLCACISSCGFTITSSSTLPISHEQCAAAMTLGYVLAAPC